MPPVGTPDAREAVSLDPPKRVSSTRLATAGSTLTTAERAEYHYVERDLRNIGILTAVMAVLLFLAWIAFTALGIEPPAIETWDLAREDGRMFTTESTGRGAADGKD